MHGGTHTHTSIIAHVFPFSAVPPESLLSPDQAQVVVDLAKHTKEACQSVSSEHKDIHASISKFGRAIDKASC